MKLPGSIKCLGATFKEASQPFLCTAKLPTTVEYLLLLPSHHVWAP